MRTLLLAVCLLTGLLSGRGQDNAPWEPIIRQNADLFPLFPLEYDADGRAVIRFLDPTQKFLIHDGKRYFGFRFQAPEKLEGDFSWMYLLRNAAGPETTGAMGWYIVRRNGKMQGFSHSSTKNVAAYPALKEKFPHTSNLILQSLGRSAFVPGEEYIIWFSLLEGDNTPQFAVAFSFTKPGQTDITAGLPLGAPRKTARPERTDADLTSYEGDPW